MKKIELPNPDEFQDMDVAEYNKIANAIIRKVKNRKSSMWWPYEVSEPVRKELTSRGYITDKSEYDWREQGWLTKIDWSKKRLEILTQP